MKQFVFLSAILLVVVSSFAIRRPPDGWIRLDKFDKQKDSFLCAPISVFYPWDVRRDSSGNFYTVTDRPLKAEDTIGTPNNAHILMERTGDYPYSFMNEYIEVKKVPGTDTLKIIIGQGDSEWFANYVIRVHGNRHKGGCEPGYPGAAEDYVEDSLHYKTTQQLLQLDKKKYNKGDSIRGYLDCSFDMWRNPVRKRDHWKANIRLTGTFKTVVQ